MDFLMLAFVIFFYKGECLKMSCSGRAGGNHAKAAEIMDCRTEFVNKNRPCVSKGCKRIMEQTSPKWSVYFQNPEFLERTRMFLIPKEMAPVVRQWCGVREGIRLLDVGCGTGYFTRLLTQGSTAVTAVGLDLEEPFIEYAKAEAAEQKLPIKFVVGDALNLPFEDASFDLVASHTFLTSVPDPERAFAEMKRVLKPGGTIASVTPMGFLPSAMSQGSWPEDFAWYKEFEASYLKFYRIYNKLDPARSHQSGLAPASVPRFFVKQGMKQICVYPLGKVFSLSNAAISNEEKLRYLALYQSSEEKKLDAFMGLPEMRELVSEEEAEHFRGLIREKCAWHRAHLNENEIWEWQGDSNLLVTGSLD